MRLMDIDIRTVLSLMFVGNLFQIPLLAFYKIVPERGRPYWHFVAAKGLESAGWLLLSMRGNIADLLSVHVGNTLLFSGYAAEMYALATVGRKPARWGQTFAAIATLGTASFFAFGSAPNLWVGYSSLTVAALALPAAAALLIPAGSTAIRRTTGAFYALFGLALLVRAFAGFDAAIAISLLSQDAIQTLAFMATFLAMTTAGIGFLLLFKEVADRELIESERKYRELSIVDNLTQVFNSRHLTAQATMEILRAERYRQPLSVLFLDIDDFKEVNDVYGHAKGDDVLARFGQILREQLRRTDSAYRYGGEEFVVLMPMTVRDEASSVAERIRVRFKDEEFRPAPGAVVHKTVSVGVAQFVPGEDLRALINRVDGNMYAAKRNGKDRVFAG